MHPTSFLSLAFLVETTLTGSVLAYIDPGSGSLLLQYMIAGMLGGFFAVKQAVAWTKGRIGPGRLGPLRPSVVPAVVLDDERRRDEDSSAAA